jgi:hypothetical protein
VELALGGTILLLHVPQIPKEFCRGWPMPRIVVVAESENFQNFGIARQRFENLYPILQIASAVDDGLVPSRGLLLNPLAVPKNERIIYEKAACTARPSWASMSETRHRYTVRSGYGLLDQLRRCMAYPEFPEWKPFSQADRREIRRRMH